MKEINSKNAWPTLVAIILILAFAFQGSRGLWRPDEGRYVQCAYEMVKTGDWITPRIDGKPHFTKPPMTYWLIASGLSLFGINEWGARAGHALAFALTAIAVGFMGARIWNHRTGLLAGLMYASTIVPFVAGNAVTADTILTLFETLAVLCFWMSMARREEVLMSSIWSLGMWFFFGLAFLTKGPVGLLPLLAIVAYRLILRKPKALPAYVTVLGVVLFAAASLPWYAAVVKQNDGLLSYFLRQEFIGRIFTPMYHRNPGWLGPFKIYLPMLTVGALPWALGWPVLLSRSRPGLLTADWWKRLRVRPAALFLILWFGMPLLILCLSKSKLELYVLPLFAPLVLATARGLVEYFPGFSFNACRLQGKSGIAVALVLVLLIGSKLASAYLPVDRDTRALWRGIRDTIHEKVGDEPYEIVIIHGNYDGLGFYSDAEVEKVETHPGTASFIPARQLSEEYEELLATDDMHVFLDENKHILEILKELQKRGLSYSVAPAPFGRDLVFCKGRLSRLSDEGRS